MNATGIKFIEQIYLARNLFSIMLYTFMINFQASSNRIDVPLYTFHETSQERTVYEDNLV